MHFESNYVFKAIVYNPFLNYRLLALTQVKLTWLRRRDFVQEKKLIQFSITWVFCECLLNTSRNSKVLTAKYPASRSTRSASRLSNLPLSEASILRHSEFSLNAFVAALTARSTSALSPSWTSMILSSVAGLMVGNVLPDAASCHSLLMKI